MTDKNTPFVKKSAAELKAESKESILKSLQNNAGCLYDRLARGREQIEEERRKLDKQAKQYDELEKEVDAMVDSEKMVDSEMVALRNKIDNVGLGPLRRY